MAEPGTGAGESIKRRKLTEDGDDADAGGNVPQHQHQHQQEQQQRRRRRSTSSSSSTPRKQRRGSSSVKACHPGAGFPGVPSHILEAYPNLEWIASHVQPDKILWSSHPHVLPPAIVIDGMNLVDQNVVNTWFVSDPTKSRITSHEQAKSAIAHHTHEQRLPSPSNNDNQYIKSEPSAAFGLPAAVEENGCKQEADSGNQLLDSYKIAADLIRRADGILIVAGAGIGVDSGLPDYRGPSGFWRAYPGLENLGLSLEDMSHPDWFEQDPAAAWGFYGHRAELYLHAIPHAGFAILRQITRLKQGNYFVFTSNIDGQFSKASFEETKLFEAHGTLAYLQCLNESCPQVWRTTSLPALRNAAFVEIHQRQHQHQHQHQNSSGGNDSNNDINQKEDGNEKVIPNPPPSSAPPPDIKPFLTIPIALVDSIPKCPGCASMARPNVSMFGDTSLSWKSVRAHQQKAKMLKFIKKYIPSLGLPSATASGTNNDNIDSSGVGIAGETTLPLTGSNKEVVEGQRDDDPACIVPSAPITIEVSANVNANAAQITMDGSGDVGNHDDVTRDPSNQEEAYLALAATPALTTATDANCEGMRACDALSSKCSPILTTHEAATDLQREIQNTTTTEEEEKTAKKKGNNKNGIPSRPKPKPKSKPITPKKEKEKRLLIIELGCGNSLHSLRCDVELLAREHTNIDVIRINPGDASVCCPVTTPTTSTTTSPTHVGLKAGALEALLQLGALLELNKADRPLRVSTKSRALAAAQDEFLLN